MGSAMRWLAPAADPGFGTAWKEAGFDDAAWGAGTYGAGHDAGAMVQTPVPAGRDVAYTRARFTIADPGAVATLANNIIWNNRHEDTGAPRNIVLDGAWFPDYCQTPGNQGIANVSHSIVEGGWPGDGNLDEDPAIVDPEGGDFSLYLFSPALDAGFGGPLAMPGVSPAALAAAFGVDAGGAPRADLPCVPDAGSGAISYVDIGPTETQAPGPCPGEPGFRRGDSNDDGSSDISDGFQMLLILFQGTAASSCDDARDVNDDGLADISDPIALLNHLFLGTAEPPPPWLDPGPDPTADALGCERG